MAKKKKSSIDVKNWTVLIHLSGLAGFMAPFGSVAAPLLLWLFLKDQDKNIDQHGKAVMNFQISYAIYGLALMVATILTLGVAGLAFIPLVILWLVQVIMGTVAASNGELHSYPFVITFLK